MSQLRAADLHGDRLISRSPVPCSCLNPRLSRACARSGRRWSSLPISWFMPGVAARSDQLVVNRADRVQTATLVGATVALRVGEPATALLNNQDPRRVIAGEIALHQVSIDLTADQTDERKRRRGGYVPLRDMLIGRRQTAWGRSRARHPQSF